MVAPAGAGDEPAEAGQDVRPGRGAVADAGVGGVREAQRRVPRDGVVVPVPREERAPFAERNGGDQAVDHRADCLTLAAADALDAGRVLEVGEPLDLQDLEAGQQPLDPPRVLVVGAAGQKLHHHGRWRGEVVPLADRPVQGAVLRALAAAEVLHPGRCIDDHRGRPGSPERSTSKSPAQPAPRMARASSRPMGVTEARRRAYSTAARQFGWR